MKCQETKLSVTTFRLKIFLQTENFWFVKDQGQVATHTLKNDETLERMLFKISQGAEHSPHCPLFSAPELVAHVILIFFADLLPAPLHAATTFWKHKKQGKDI